MKPRSQGLLPRLSLEAVKVRSDGTREESRLVAVNSWHKQMIWILESCFGHRSLGVVVPRAADGTLRSVNSAGTPDTGMFSVDTEGIVVGSGTDSLVATDHRLVTKITNLSFETVVISETPQPISGGYRISIERQFVNETGGTVTVNEVGVQALTNTDSQANSESMLILRDLVIPAITILDTEGVIFRYHLDFL